MGGLITGAEFNHRKEIMKTLIRSLLFSALLLCGHAFGASGQWSTNAPYNVDGSVIEFNTIGIPARSPTQFWPVVQVNDSLPAGNESAGWDVYPQDTWVTINVSNWVPVGAKAIRLDGMLILSHSGASGLCEVTVAYRSVGETFDYSYLSQTIDVFSGSGQRSNTGTWVALNANRSFQIKWHRAGTLCYNGFNLRMTAYGR